MFLDRREFRKFAVVFGLLVFSPALASAADLKVGLVLDRGGKDDKSFNASAFLGATEAQKSLGVQVKTVEAPDDNAFGPLLRKLAQMDYDLVIAIGVAQAESVRKVAALFPKTRFAIVDAQVDAPNVRSLLFEEHEGSYLMGAAAALASRSGKLGFLGGMEIPLIRRFQTGFEAGARSVNPGATVVSNYVGVTSEAWNNPTKAKELALSQFDSGADVVFAAAGASGMGLFDAVEQRSRSGRKVYAIGCDSNQNWIRPGLVLTSMLKRVDIAVLNTIRDVKNGRFTAGVVRFGLSNQGVDYALDQHNGAVLVPAIRAKLDAVKAGIVSGKVRVPDYYLQAKSKK